MTTTYYVDATSGTCTTATRTAVVATVNAIPTITGTTPGSFCGSGSVTLGATASEGTIDWYADPTGGASLGSGTSFVTPVISASTTYYVDATFNGCTTSSRTPVVATINSVAMGGTISGTSSIVYGSSTGTLTLSGYSGTILNWQKRLDSGVWIDINNTSGTYSETPNSVGTWQYRVVVQNSCSTVYSATFSIVVSPAALTITADNVIKTYGSPNPDLTMSCSGFVNGDNVLSIALPVISTTALTGSVPGNYPLSLSGGSAQNYLLTLVNGNLKINKADLTFIAANQSKNYLDPNPTLTYTIAGFVTGDTQDSIEHLPTIQTSADQSSPAGDYPITISGGTDDCYNLIYQSGILSIEKIPQTITITDVPSKLYVKEVYNIIATSTSGLPVQFESIYPDVASVNGNKLCGVSAGKAQIRAFIDGDQNYYSAEAFTEVEISTTHRDIMHLFTPNNDGINDRWEIPDLATYGKCDVKVYNRWGMEVYSNKDYDNLWDGTSNGTPLPEGPYYFVIKTESSGIITGTVNIVR